MTNGLLLLLALVFTTAAVAATDLPPVMRGEGSIGESPVTAFFQTSKCRVLSAIETHDKQSLTVNFDGRWVHGNVAVSFFTVFRGDSVPQARWDAFVKYFHAMEGKDTEIAMSAGGWMIRGGLLWVDFAGTQFEFNHRKYDLFADL